MAIISDESILNKIPLKTASNRSEISLDALVSVIKMIGYGYDRLVLLLETSELTNRLLEEIIMQTWSVIGNMHRLNSLMRHTAGIDHSEPWFQTFRRNIEDSSDMRDFIEHYDEKINSLLTEVKPLLGHISFAQLLENKKILVKALAPGRLRKFQGLGVVNPVGKPFRARIDHITYCFGNETLSISDLFYATKTFASELEKYAEEKYGDT